MLTLLNLSAAFDTVNRVKLLRWLEVSCGLRSHVLGWFQSYLNGRTHYVHHGTASSTITFLSCGVPHGSVHRPILFVLYMADWLQ